MKRWSLAASVVLAVAVCLCTAYWVMQLKTPSPRPEAAVSQTAASMLNIDALTGLFGGRTQAQVTSNFELTGVVVADDPASSVAIIAESGKPARAVKLDGELVPGVVIREVHPKYVLLSDSGAIKRVELPEKAPAGANGHGNGAMLPPRAPIEPPTAEQVPPAPMPPPAPQDGSQVPPSGAPTNVPPPGAVVSPTPAGEEVPDGGASGLPMRNRNVQRRIGRSGGQPFP